jgi:predicted  nucleic acid-binding Zn-ribbon protein
MTHAAIWIASCLGALLFLLAGFLLARRPARPTERAAGSGAGVEGQLKAALERELRLVAELAVAQGGQTGARAELREREQELAALRDERARLERERDELLQRLESTRRASDPSSTAAERDSLERELEQARSELWARTTETKRLRASLAELQAEKKELLAQIDPEPPSVPTAIPDSRLKAELERLRVSLLHLRSERDTAVARTKQLEAEAQRLRRTQA